MNANASIIIIRLFTTS